MDRVRDLYHPDAIVRAPPGWPEPGPEVGREAVMQQYRLLREAFDRDSIQLLSDFESVGDRVVVRIDWGGVGHGPESSMEMTMVGTVRDGKLYTVEFLWDHDEARAAVGL